MLASTSITFDLSVFEIFVPLARGGTVILAGNALELPAAAGAGEVRLVNTVPRRSAPSCCAADELPPSVRTVNLAGEALLGRWPTGSTRGPPGVAAAATSTVPSEDTTYSTSPRMRRRRRRAGDRPPVHRHAGYVLDRRLQPVPVGVAGELYLGGERVGARLLEPAGADRRALRARSVRGGPAGGCTAPATWCAGGRTAPRVPGPHRPSGQGARLPHRAGRDRSRAGGAIPVSVRPWSCAGARARRAASWPGSCPRDRRPPRPAICARSSRAAPGLHGAVPVRAPRGHAAQPERQDRPQGAARSRHGCAGVRQGGGAADLDQELVAEIWAEVLGATPAASTTASSISAGTRCSPPGWSRASGRPSMSSCRCAPCSRFPRCPLSPPGSRGRPRRRGSPGSAHPAGAADGAAAALLRAAPALVPPAPGAREPGLQHARRVSSRRPSRRRGPGGGALGEMVRTRRGRCARRSRSGTPSRSR